MRTRSKLILVVLPVILVAASVCLLLYLRGERMREFARATLISRLEKATRMECTVGRVDFDLLHGRFRLMGLTLKPRTGDTGPLTLQIEEINGRVGISSIWHFSLHLAELNIIRPQLQLASTQDQSGWNPEDVLKSLRLSLDLAAGKVQLNDGWVEINNARIPITLSLDDLSCEIHYKAHPPHYSIRLAYKNSRLLYEGRDVKYDLDTDLSLSMKGVDVDSFTLRRGKSLFVGEGWVRNWKSPVLLLHATGNLDSEDLALFTSDLAPARGSTNVATNFRVDANGLRLDGKFNLQAGGFRGATLSALQGVFEIRNDVLWLKSVEGKLGKGTIRAEGEIQLRESNKAPHHVSVTSKEVPLREISYILNLPELDFTNPVDSSAELIWTHPAQDLDLKAQATLLLPSESRPELGRSMLFQGNVAFSYRRGYWYFATANLKSPYTAVEITGHGDTTFHIQARSSKLAEPLAVLRRFVPSLESLLSREPKLTAISGTFGLDGEMLLEPERTLYRGDLTVENGQWESARVDSLTSKADWEGSHLELHELNLRKDTESADGDLTLEIPSEEGETLGISFRGKVNQIPLASLRDLGIDVTPDITGTLSGSGSVSNADDTWNCDAQLLIQNGSYKGESFDAVRGRIKARNEVVQIEDCQIVRGAAKVNARGQVRLDTKQLDLALNLADLSLTEIPGIPENKDFGGRISAGGNLRGAIENPSFKGDFELSRLRYASWDLGGGKGTAEIQDRVLQGSANIQSGLGKVGVQAKMSTESGLPGKATLDFSELNVQKLLAGNIPALLSDLSTALHGKVDVTGNFAEPAGLAASGEVDGGRFRLHDYELRNAGKMQFSVSNRNLRIERVNIVGEGSSLLLSGVFPLDNSPRLDLNLSGDLNLAFLQQVEKKARISGTALLNVRVTGAMREPQVIGQATLKNTRLEYGDSPLRFSALQGNIVFSRNLVRFENITGSSGSGSIRVSGLFEHQNGELRGINLQASAKGVRVPYPKDFRSLIDAELVLRGGQEAQVLSGEIKVVRADYLKDINLLEQLITRSNSSPGPLTTDSFLQGLRLDIDIHSDRGLVIDNELTRLRASMFLTLKGTPAYPYLTGRAESSEGSIFFRGNRFDIVHASADFIDRNRINPVLDVRAEADVKTYRLVMDLNGDLDHLSINVTSDPPLSTVEIVSLLTTGKSLEPATETTKQQSEMAGISAASILSEGLTGVLGKRVQRIFGLQTFRVDPFLAGAENDPTARVTISERISKDLNLTFSRNLSTNEEQIVVVEYDVTRNLTIVASRDEQGKLGLDFRFRKRFR